MQYLRSSSQAKEMLVVGCVLFGALVRTMQKATPYFARLLQCQPFIAKSLLQPHLNHDLTVDVGLVYTLFTPSSKPIESSLECSTLAILSRIKADDGQMIM